DQLAKTSGARRRPGRPKGSRNRLLNQNPTKGALKKRRQQALRENPSLKSLMKMLRLPASSLTEDTLMSCTRPSEAAFRSGVTGSRARRRRLVTFPCFPPLGEPAATDLNAS